MRVFRRFLREVSTSSKRLPGVFQETLSVVLIELGGTLRLGYYPRVDD